MIEVRLPDDLTGKVCLDVGCYDGGTARRCLERGAAAAYAIDNREYRRYGDWGEPGWDLLGVRYAECDLFDWIIPADLVIASNVIYHIADPFEALAKLRWLTRWKLLLRTSFVGGDEEVEGPAGWIWYPGGMGHPTGTVPCRPSPGGLRASLRAAGFTEITEQGREGDHIVVECS